MALRQGLPGYCPLTPRPLLMHILYLVLEALVLIRRHVVTMAVNADGVVESLDVFEDKAVCMSVVPDFEPVKPFSLNQGVK